MTWEYIAGFFDGEGNINATSSRGTSWQIRIVQADRSILEKIQKFLLSEGIDSRLYLSYKASDYFKSAKDLYSLNIAGRDNSTRFLLKIVGLVRVKKAIVEDVLRFFTLYPTRAPYARGKLNGTTCGLGTRNAKR